MPAQWTATVPVTPHALAFRILRVPTDGTLKLCLTSNDLVGCHTHWWNGRTVPCTLPACPPHEAGSSTRWHGYLAALLSKTREHVIWEFTALAAEAIEAYRSTHPTLRGALVTAHRFTPKPTARVHCILSDAQVGQLALPDPPDLTAVLSHLWGLPTQTTDAVGRPGPRSRARNGQPARASEIIAGTQ